MQRIRDTRLEGDVRDHLLQPFLAKPWSGQDKPAPSPLGLKSTQCWESTPSPGKLFQQLIVLIVKNVPFMTTATSPVTCTRFSLLL